MKHFFIALALLTFPATAIAHEGGIPADSTASDSAQAEIKASPTVRPTPADTGTDCDDAAGCAAPTKKPSPTPCRDNDEDCDGRIAPSSTISPTDGDSDDDGIDDIARQTPKRDFGDRMKAGLHAVGSFFSKIGSWMHNSAKSIIQNLKG